jgi:large subunit ribosomal protein L1
MAHSKRYSELKKLIDSKKAYAPAEAIELVKKTATTKFDGSIELHANLGIDVKKSDQIVRFTIVMPHASGKLKKVAAFVPADKEKDAKDAGAEIVGAEDLIEEISKTGKADFDVAVATPDMMPKLAKLAKILGPKGLMPNPKTDTVGTNVKKMVEELKKGKVTVKMTRPETSTRWSARPRWIPKRFWKTSSSSSPPFARPSQRPPKACS